MHGSVRPLPRTDKEPDQPVRVSNFSGRGVLTVRAWLLFGRRDGFNAAVRMDDGGRSVAVRYDD